MHLCGKVFNDPRLFSPLDDGVAKLAQEEVAVDNGEVVRELLVDILDGSHATGHDDVGVADDPGTLACLAWPAHSTQLEKRHKSEKAHYMTADETRRRR